MELYRSIMTGILGMFAMEGIDIIEMDENTGILKLAIPKDSFSYHENGSTIHNAEEYAKRIKEKFIELGIKNIRVLYKEKDIYWTKEMSKSNFERAKNSGELFV